MLNPTHPSLVSKFFLNAGAAAKRPVLYHPSGISLRDNPHDPRGGPGPHPHQVRLSKLTVAGSHSSVHTNRYRAFGMQTAMTSPM